MAIWYILGFFYFIAVDLLIFMQKWDWLVISLIAGVIFVVIVLITRSVVAEAPAQQAGEEPQPTQPVQPVYPHDDQQMHSTIQTPSQQQNPASFSAALAFFYVELFIIIGLVVYLFMRG